MTSAIVCKETMNFEDIESLNNSSRFGKLPMSEIQIDDSLERIINIWIENIDYIFDCYDTWMPFRRESYFKKIIKISLKYGIHEIYMHIYFKELERNDFYSEKFYINLITLMSIFEKHSEMLFMDRLYLNTLPEYKDLIELFN
jgi:hypothetical protein